MKTFALKCDSNLITFKCTDTTRYGMLLDMPENISLKCKDEKVGELISMCCDLI